MLSENSDLAAGGGPATSREPVELPDEVKAGLAGEKSSPGAIVRFLENRVSPVVGPGWALFFWIGPAEHVDILRWIHAGVDRQPFRHVSGTEIWLLRIPVVDGGRFEYKLSVRRGGQEEWILDPRNPERAADPFGENSVCRTWGYRPPEWAVPRGAPQGRIESIEVDSAVFGERRFERIYLPAGVPEGRPLPLVITHDGDDYDAYADLSVSLDNLIAAGDIPPLAAVLIQTKDRMGEYSRARRHARYLVHELLPEIARRHEISEAPADRILMGASLGAVAALSTAFRFPGVFGGLVLKSGTFILNEGRLESRPHPVFRRTAELVRALRRAPDLPSTRAFVSTGALEGLAEDNAALAKVLRAHGVDVLFKSAWDGHHWHNWRDQLRDGLMWVLRRDDATG